VGTPKGRLTQLEAALTQQPWQQARQRVQVKLLPQAGELYVLVHSGARVDKERAMRRRKLKKLWQRLRQLQTQRPGYERLLLELGAAKKEAGRVWSLVRVAWPAPPPARAKSRRVSFAFTLRKDALRKVRRREGRYLLRSNLTETDPGKLWEFYLQLVEIEAAFKNLKGNLALRPIYHQRADRIEAHVLVSFLAYCVQVSLREKLRRKAPGLTPRSVLEKFGALAMHDVHFPTTDGRELIFARYTQPEAEQELLLDQLGWKLPVQSPPRITAKREVQM